MSLLRIIQQKHGLRILIIISGLALINSIAFATKDTYLSVKHDKKYPVYPTVEYGTGPNAQRIKKGEYLVKMGDCIACHTQANDKPFAGGFAIATPFGTIYTPNITPDKKTGIGNWTDEQFSRAVHKGIRPDGKFYYPAFPYPYFNRITKEDVLAIRAYLNAVPAVYHKNLKNTMMFPFNWRFLQLGWRILFFKDKGPYKVNTKQSEEWNRGAYLVKSLGHCSMCHTPSHYILSKKWVLAAPIKKYYLTGGFVEGFYAPNITSTNLKDTSAEQLGEVFKQDKLLGGGEVEGPMAEANHDSLKYLTQEDIQAIATYLESVKSQIPPRPKASSPLAEGKNIYDTYCTGCHTSGAGGAPKLGDIKDWAPRIKLGLNQLYKNAWHGIGGMPAKGTCGSCTLSQIQDAVQYIVSKSKEGAAGATTGTKLVGKPIKKLTMADGKAIYEKRCSVCHEGNYPSAPKVGDKQVWAPLINQGMSVLLERAIKGYKNHPPKGGCETCNDAEIIAATKYMVQESATKGDYRLW